VLLFRFRGDYGIIHGVAPFWLVGFASRYYTEDRREGATLFHGRSRERQPYLPSLAEKWVNSSLDKYTSTMRFVVKYAMETLHDN